MSYYPLKYDENGNCIPNPAYKEIHVLRNMLVEAKIPHDFHKFRDGYQVVYPEDTESRVADAVEFFGSYGEDQDKLEIMGLLTEQELKNDSVLGHLTAKEVFDRIKKHWEEHKHV